MILKAKVDQAIRLASLPLTQEITEQKSSYRCPAQYTSFFLFFTLLASLLVKRKRPTPYNLAWFPLSPLLFIKFWFPSKSYSFCTSNSGAFLQHTNLPLQNFNSLNNLTPPPCSVSGHHTWWEAKAMNNLGGTQFHRKTCWWELNKPFME